MDQTMTAFFSDSSMSKNLVLTTFTGIRWRSIWVSVVWRRVDFGERLTVANDDLEPRLVIL
jgi:hypothetical protein